MDEFRNLDRDIENNSKRWRKFIEGESPEKDKFPQVRANQISGQNLKISGTTKSRTSRVIVISLEK